MIQINKNLFIEESELSYKFVTSPGPGGQNVNRVSTTAQLTFNAAECFHISDEIRSRLRKLAGKKMNRNDVLLISAKRYRSQERNRQDALKRFVDLVNRASEPPKSRKPTKPSIGSIARRLKSKKNRSTTKQNRKVSDLEHL